MNMADNAQVNLPLFPFYCVGLSILILGVGCRGWGLSKQQLNKACAKDLMDNGGLGAR